MMWTRAFSKKDSFLDKAIQGKRADDEALSWKNAYMFLNIESSNQIKGLTPYQNLGKLTSRTKKERDEVCW